MKYITREQRYDLIDTHVTLNGKPAKISGAMMEYAMVSTLDGSLSFEWAWVTVARIVAAGGKFVA